MLEIDGARVLRLPSLLLEVRITMLVKFAVAVLVALSGLVAPAPSPGSAPNPDDVRTVIRSTGAADDLGAGAASPTDVTVEVLDIAVPPVEVDPAEVPAPDSDPEADLDAEGDPDVDSDDDLVVADQLVAPGRVESEVVDATGFQTVGVTWPEGSAVDGLGGQVRARTDGEWSAWVDLEPGDESPDQGTPDAAQELRGGTDPVSIGDADAVQLAFAASAEGGPQGLTLALIGSDEQVAPDSVVGSADASSATGEAVFRIASTSTRLAQAQAGAPRIISRGEWGAPAQVCTPAVAGTLLAAVVHHTAGSNSYSSVADAMQQLRNDAAYHITGRGWCDLGYNFVVDKWGNIYEGRAGSLSQPVIGVHAGGFNTATVGVSMLGDYSSLTPPAATTESVARIIAWRLGAYNRDPASTTTYTTYGGENSRYGPQTLVIPVVLGHRDVAFTACPGQAGYSTLGWVRARARQLVAPTWVNPGVSATSVARGTALTVRAGTVSNIDWTLTTTDTRTGIVAARSSGYAQQALGGVVATWDGTGPSGVVGPGPYRLTLSGVESGSGVVVREWSVAVTVTGSQNPPPVARVALGSGLRFVPIAPQRLADTRTTVTALGARSRMDVVVAGVAGIPSDARAVAVTLTAVHASATTHLRAWPAGQPLPASSVLNTDPSRTVATHVMLGVGGERKVSVYNDSGSVHVALDVSGYYVSSGGAQFEPVPSPTRLLDTRTQGARLGSGTSRTVAVTGRGGVPSTATAVVVNVTSVGAASSGYVVAVPHGAAASTASTVNHQPGGDATNRATVQLAAGSLDVRLVGGSADVVVDVVGWFGSGATTRFTPIAPVRAFDTRSANNPVRAGEARSVAVQGTAGVPSDTRAVVAIITATQPSAAATFVTVWSGTGARPGTSDLNTGSGRDQANLSVSAFASGGSMRIFNNLGTTHVVGDVYGYFR